MALLRQARSEQPEMEVIVLTAHGTVVSLPRISGHRGYAASTFVRQSDSVSFGLL